HGQAPVPAGPPRHTRPFRPFHPPIRLIRPNSPPAAIAEASMIVRRRDRTAHVTVMSTSAIGEYGFDSDAEPGACRGETVGADMACSATHPRPGWRLKGEWSFGCPPGGGVDAGPQLGEFCLGANVGAG